MCDKSKSGTFYTATAKKLRSLGEPFLSQMSKLEVAVNVFTAALT